MFIVPSEVLVTSSSHFKNKKTPGFLILGSLKFVVYFLFYTTVSRTLGISGVRSYDRLPQLIVDQPEAIKPACLGIVLNCWCLKFDCILSFSFSLFANKHHCLLTSLNYSAFQHLCQQLLESLFVVFLQHTWITSFANLSLLYSN